ncbi:MAG: tetratricopeptide repeat protein [Candidatus Cloacimonadales bacterium]|nr:tetratricopeptide repeat protein [Candidatus Cloacimonadales bacterium]
MKKIVFTFALITLLAGSLLAEVEKVAIVNFQRVGHSEYVYNAMKNKDFQSVFDEDNNLELIKLKDADKVFKSLGYDYIGTAEAAAIGTELNANFVIWGSVSVVDIATFKVQLTVYSMITKDVFPIIFDVTKKKEERIEAIKINLVIKIKDSVSAEIQKLLDIGLQQFNSKNLQSAEESFLSLVKIDPTIVETYLYLGAIKFLQKDYQKSSEFYEQGLELDPENVTMLDYLSKTYEKLGEYEAAAGNLEKIVELDENNKEVWYRIGSIYTEIEYFDEAQAAFEKAVELDPNYAEAQLALGILFYDQEMYDAAIQPLEFATNAYPDIDSLQKKLAKCYLKTGKLKNAIAKYKEVLIEQPQNVNAYLNLAGAYRVTDQNDEALKTLLSLKKIAPNEPKVFFRLADVYLAMKNNTKAAEMANLAMGLDNKLYDSYLILAQINFNYGYEKYEKFLDYEEKYKDKSVYYGEKADKLVADRDKVKQEAYDFFCQEESFLNKAQERTDDPSALKEISGKRDILKQLKAATKPGGF